MLQAKVVIYMKRAKYSANRLKDWVVVQESEYLILHIESEAADLFSDWIVANPNGLSYFCNLSSCDLPWAALPEFIRFYDHLKDVGGLVIKQRGDSQE